MASSNDSPFGYNASFPLAIVGAILFCLVGIIHFYQFFRYQTYCFYPMLLALISEWRERCTINLVLANAVRSGDGRLYIPSIFNSSYHYSIAVPYQLHYNYVSQSVPKYMRARK